MRDIFYYGPLPADLKICQVYKVKVRFVQINSTTVS